MLKGKELFLLIFTGNKNEKKRKRGERKVLMVAKLKKKSLREKNNLYILG